MDGLSDKGMDVPSDCASNRQQRLHVSNTINLQRKLDQLNRSINKQNFDFAPDKEDGDDAALGVFLQQVSAFTAGKHAELTPRFEEGGDSPSREADMPPISITPTD